MKSSSPRVFVCHASADKERFVLGFATKLRAKGVDAWVDQWEMLPGDSLVDRIFEEGIKNDDAFIVVLSKYSVDKPWVREEMNAQVVKRIEDRSKLIPILIDLECEPKIPLVLRSTVWQIVKDIHDYEAELDRVVRAIYGHVDKPALGAAPAYTSATFDTMPGLTRGDSIVLKLSCNEAFDTNRNLLSVQDLMAQAKEYDISQQHCMEILEILNNRGYLTVSEVLGPERYYWYSITSLGLDEYAKVHRPDYDKAVAAVGLRILNHGETMTQQIAAALGESTVWVDHVFDLFEDRGYISTSKYGSGEREIDNVSPELGRALSSRG